MAQDNIAFYSPIEELDDDLNINFEKIDKTLKSRRMLTIKVFCLVLLFFILLTYILPKKYTVTADLYINKTNSSNMLEFNPYMIDDSSSSGITMGADKAINNELELMKSELVLDKVIRDNNIVYKKKFGIFPNKKEGEFLTAEAFYKKGKVLKLDNVKNTNVITIKYKSNKPEIAYGVVSSLIANYIELHKELNVEKSRSDINLLESEYNKIKEDLNKKISQAKGLPAQSMTGIGNLSAMSAFSNSASHAINSIKSQYIADEKSQIAIREDSQKLAQIAAKLEWAKMVEQMSDTSKVLVIKEPKLLRPFENSSPKLFMNIVLGCIFGFIAALIALIHVERTDKKLTYSALSENIFFNISDDFDLIKTEILGYMPKEVLLISLTQLKPELFEKISKFENAKIINADITKEFINDIAAHDIIMIISKIQDTKKSEYQTVQNIINKQNKKIAYDILV